MHLIILTQYCQPEIGVPQARSSELAARSIKRGHRVTVITGMPNYPAAKIQPGYGGLWRRETRDGVEILRTFTYPTKSASFALRVTNYLSFRFSSALLCSILVGC
jgi:colanic acid biosynthesis glycosyl transferase WcaI